jgi:hypothetical protein
MDQASSNPLPDLVLWRGDGCHLCDDARALLTALLAERAAAGRRIPALVERRIADDPAVERELLEQIPVLDYAGRRLPLAIRAGAVRAFLSAAIDGPAAVDGPGAITDGEIAGDLEPRAGQGA